MRHSPERPLDRPLATLLTGGVEPGGDVALSEDSIRINEFVEHGQDLGADTTFRLTRENADPTARQTHQSRFRLGYRRLRPNAIVYCPPRGTEADAVEGRDHPNVGAAA